MQQKQQLRRNNAKGNKSKNISGPHTLLSGTEIFLRPCIGKTGCYGALSKPSEKSLNMKKAERDIGSIWADTV